MAEREDYVSKFSKDKVTLKLESEMKRLIKILAYKPSTLVNNSEEVILSYPITEHGEPGGEINKLTIIPRENFPHAPVITPQGSTYRHKTIDDPDLQDILNVIKKIK